MFTLSFDKGRKFRKVVRGWKQSLGNLKWFWPAAHGAVAKVHQRLFDSEGGTGRHGKWTDLASATQEFRAKGVGYYGRHVGMAAPEGPVLHWTYRLRDSLDQFHGSDGTVNSVRRSYRTKMVFGTSHGAAWELHTGSLGLPARELLDEEGSRKAVVNLFNRNIVKQLKFGTTGRFFTPR